jgi:catechol 2,3-dioxygenase-like lactoylglutathione lyase family enzyme
VGTSWNFSNFLPILIDTTATYSLTIDGLGVRHLAVVSKEAELWHVRESGIPDPSNPPVAVRIPLPPSFHPDTTAVAAAANGAHVLFHDAVSGSLHHSSNGSGGWVTEIVDQNPLQDVGGFCAAAIDVASGRLHVAYYDATNGDLKYARKDPGGVWVRKVLDAEGDVGSHVSIVLDAMGAVHIAYRDETGRRLKIARGTP